VYSRAGYGASSPAELPRSPDYMHVEALETLPAVLTALGVERPTLVGHSDGASIALIHAGAHPASVEAVVAMAPHVFVEPVTLASIEAARTAYGTTDLGTKLARYHDDPDAAFRGWNDIWLSPSFRDWSIVDHLPAITCPLLLLQGADDEYGSEAQLEAIAERVGGPVECALVDNARHSPFRDAREETLKRITRFLARVS
jgi:pimeloyl-ACP methyl ester carboxylesterase